MSNSSTSYKTAFSELLEDLDLRCCFNQCRPSHNRRNQRPSPDSRRLNPNRIDSSPRELSEYRPLSRPDSSRYQDSPRPQQCVNQGTQTDDFDVTETAIEDEAPDYKAAYYTSRQPTRFHPPRHNAVARETFVRQPAVPFHAGTFTRRAPHVVTEERVFTPEYNDQLSDVYSPHQPDYGQGAYPREMMRRSEDDARYDYDRSQAEEGRHEGTRQGRKSNWSSSYPEEDVRGPRSRVTPWCVAVGFIISLCSLGIPLLLIGAILIFIGDSDSATYKAGIALLIIASLMAITGIVLVIFLYSGFCGKKPNSIFGSRNNRLGNNQGPPNQGPDPGYSRTVVRPGPSSYTQPMRPSYSEEEPTQRVYHKEGNYDYQSPKHEDWKDRTTRVKGALTDSEEYERESPRKSHREPQKRQKNTTVYYDRNPYGRRREERRESPRRMVIRQQPRRQEEGRYNYDEPRRGRERVRYEDRRAREEHDERSASSERRTAPVRAEMESEDEQVRTVPPPEEPKPVERKPVKKKQKKPRHRSVKLEDPKEEDFGGIPASKKKLKNRLGRRRGSIRGQQYPWDKLSQNSPQKSAGKPFKRKKPETGPLRDRYYMDDDVSTEGDVPPAYEPGTRNAYPWYVDPTEKTKPKPKEKKKPKMETKTAWESDHQMSLDRCYNYNDYLRNVLGNVQWPSRDQRKSYPEPEPGQVRPPNQSLDEMRGQPDPTPPPMKRFFTDDVITYPRVNGSKASPRKVVHNDDIMRQLC